MSEVALYVPRPGALVQIHRGSAVAGTPGVDGICVDFEGRGDTFEDRLIHAAGRHVARYPTIARARLPETALLQVGTATHRPELHAWIVTEITDPGALRTWLTPEDLPEIGGSFALRQRAAGINAARLPATVVADLQARHPSVELIDRINAHALHAGGSA
ncbi:hypothetical protein CKO28_04815 [Rhodovibrio sodomensis]|uniref:Uncharacterized protein n=1 Tax=Rhodovibrio sodomensis TaxID=1088 RepID=A0ABS1DAG0_9PROT|nr:hypothetical protein [Rhodovibrio sodomensis]MBK1667350.1 hypothetical protein [Rhodovibrio sodomensis]